VGGQRAGADVGRFGALPLGAKRWSKEFPDRSPPPWRAPATPGWPQASSELCTLAEQGWRPQ
jgi:hypothetical protein